MSLVNLWNNPYWQYINLSHVCSSWKNLVTFSIVYPSKWHLSNLLNDPYRLHMNLCYVCLLMVWPSVHLVGQILDSNCKFVYFFSSFFLIVDVVVCTIDLPFCMNFSDLLCFSLLGLCRGYFSADVQLRMTSVEERQETEQSWHAQCTVLLIVIDWI